MLSGPKVAINIEKTHKVTLYIIMESTHEAEWITRHMKENGTNYLRFLLHKRSEVYNVRQLLCANNQSDSIRFPFNPFLAIKSEDKRAQ
ncbi:hypothetical protein GCM10025859_30500 [Alicyclobacillus fastidiosus]|nr:hypothetical protein GCM10025859_30500 [Alicyclobacillus fastidiosus]